ncbi:LOW QUALITY PROTEIN: proteasome adapter and scaffold protein ECM29-like [Mya arenaria]|uniref:LOW QUALITY PROTEIN: proteasome adapter and scaffold protein ECM29-like n=1 Tax=Mya arenaria TaxID=6604 RepID=UPI0022E53CBA|nr:LOW QUALITY PROTEIN: proteasome adapter and scaffold protein ECM29-like [Mya arenaria]
MASSDENALVERVFLRIGSAETDEQLESALARFLTPVLLKLDSKEDGVRKKVMELLVHVNKRLKSLTRVQLPVDDLIVQFKNPEASSIVTNFTVIYIKLGFPRLEPEKQGERVPALLSCLEGRSQSQQDSFLQLLMPALEKVKMPPSMDQRREMFACITTPAMSKLLLTYMLDLLLVPYGSHAKIAELQQAQTRRPATAPASNTPNPIAPPGLSITSFRRVMGDNPYQPEQLEKVKLGIVKFLGGDLFTEKDVVCHYIVGAADTRHSVATAADMELKKIIGTVDLNDSDILTKLFAIILGTLEFKGQTPIKPEFKVMQACTRIRMKIMPYILKARESANTFPCNIQVIFDLLYGQNTNTKLKVHAIQMIHHMCLHCTDNKFSTFSPILQTKLVNLVRDAQEDRKVLSLAYVALGKLVHRFPQLVATNIALVQVFFDVMCQVDSDMRLAVQEALSLMANAFKDLSELNQKMMVALLMEAIDKEEPQARMMAVQYAEKIFPKDHVASRYILLLAAGDQKEDIRLEAVKGLHAAQGDEKLTSRPVEPAAKVVLPDFSKMVEFVKEKADIRVTTQNRVVISNSTLPFNQTTFTEILLYLRSCLAHSASLVPDMDGVSAMKEQAPEISKYVQGLMKENNTDRGPVQTYVNLTQMLLKAVGGSTPMYCLLEMVAMAPTELVPQFVQHLGWIKTTVFSMKDDIRDLAANLYAIIVCKHTDEGQLLEALEFMLNSMNNKSLEAQHGAILTLGHLIGQLLRRRRLESSQGGSLWQKMEKAVEQAVIAIARLVKVTDENNPMLAAGACQAIGEIGRNAPLPLPSGSEGELEGEITKLSVVKNLLAIIKSGKENTKSKERAALCLGQLCVGEEKFPHRKLAIQGLLDAVTSKQIELHFTLGEALVFAAQGPTSPAGRDLWTQTEEEWKAIANYSEDEVEWYLTTVLERYVTSANPHVRQASSVWLLALVKKCSSHPALQSRLQNLQSAFMQLLSENDDLTQDISSKGLGLVYEICSTEQKSALVSELVDTLMTGKRKQQTVSADTQVFEEGSIGKTPEGSGLSTYKELCSIANELNQPDLIYKFMHLANHHAMWNSRKGAAFGFTTIAAQAGEQLAPFLPQIVPRLYRYQFDPNMKIQQAMTSIWNALVQDNKNTVDKYMKEILADLLTNLTNNQWRIRESSCLAVHDLLRGHALDDVVESLPELWESCLRVLDDIKESVRKAAELACNTLSRASIKICDVSYGKVGERATTVVLPCLLKCGLQSPVSEVRALGLSTILKISKNAGVLLKPHIPVLVTALLEAISGLEPQVMNYLSVRVSNEETQHRLDNARIMASKMSPMMETVNLCVQYVDESVLPEMVPRLTELIKSGIGVGTKAACSHFVVSLVHQCPKDLTPHTGKLMGAFLNGVADRNMAVRKSYALALGHLVRIAKDSSVEKLITRMRSWYLEKEEEAAHNGCGLTLHAISQQSSDILKRHASLTMPLAFLAMHELAKDGSSNKGDDSLSLWEEVWTEVTPGTEGGIKLYLAEIVSLLQETIQSQSWATKAQAARAISTVADKLGAKLGPPHLGNLIEALLLGLQGRTWAGKEALLHALQTVCKSCSSSIKGSEEEDFVTKIIEDLLRESRKESIKYKLEALTCLGEVVEIFEVDRFQDVYAILAPVIEKKEEDMEVDEEKEELNSDVKEGQLVCYYTVLGQIWPIGARNTQEARLEGISCLLCEALQGNTRKIQEAIMKTMHKVINRLECLQDVQKFSANEPSVATVLQRMILSVLPCLGNLKYTVIRTEALEIVNDIIPKLTEFQKLQCLSNETVEKLRTDLATMTADSSPEIQDKSKTLLVMLNA